jgi:hypothetical protein
MFHRPSRDELAQRKARKEQRQLDRVLHRESKYYQRLIPDVLASLGLDHWLRKESRPTVPEALVTGRRSHQKVRFLECRASQSALYFRVDPTSLPYRVSILSFLEEGILETLSVACARMVTYKWQAESGAWLIVHRDGSIAAIPTSMKFHDAIKNPPPGPYPLRYTAGVAENMKLVQPDIAAMPHLIIAGATGSGKSVGLNSILCQLLLRNSPNRLRLTLIDLKGGMELQDYSELPHLRCPIIKEAADVIPALRSFRAEMQERERMFAGKARDIMGWNHQHKDRRLPYELLVVEELAQIMRHPDSHLRTQAEELLGSIMAVSRATGGHVILCTQRPSVDVVTGFIKANVPGRIAFACATQADSRTILDTSDAAGLEPVGRAVMLRGSKRVLMQTPYISPHQIRMVISHIMKRGYKPPPPPLTFDELCLYAVENLGGGLPVRPLYLKFSDRINYVKLAQLLRQHDNEIVTVCGEQYQVIGSVGRNGRKLKKLTEPDKVNVAVISDSEDGIHDEPDQPISDQLWDSMLMADAVRPGGLLSRAKR